MTEKVTNHKLNWLMIGFLLTILYWATFNHGLFLTREFFNLNILVGISGLVYIVLIKHQNKVTLTKLDYAIGLYGIAYFFSIFASANTAEAIAHTLRVWSFISFYLILSRIFIKSILHEVYLKAVILLGVLVSLFGLLTVNNIYFTYELSWTDTLSSTLQYHNAFATFLIPIILLAGYFASQTKSIVLRVAYFEAVYIMSLGLAGSQSRGGYLVFALLIFGYFIVFGRNNLIQFIVWLMNVGVGFVLWDSFYKSSINSQQVSALGWIGLGLLLVLIIGFLSTLQSKLNVGNKKAILILGLILLTIVVVSGTLFVDLNGDVVERIKQINLSDHSVEERFVFYQDAFRMFKDNFILGLGGGGWASAYQSYQSYLYHSTEVHSLFLNIMVETGILGLLCFLSVIGLIFYVIYKNCKKVVGNGQRELNLILGLGLLGLLLHATVDFNFSKGAVSLLFWSLVATVRALHEQVKTPEAKNSFKNVLSSNAAIQMTLAFMSISLLVLPIIFISSASIASKGVEAASTGDYAKAVNYYKSATRLNPFESKYWSDMASINSLLAKRNKEKNATQDSIEYLDKALSRAKYDVNARIIGAGVLSNLGDYKSAYQLAMETVNLTPFRNEVYVSAAQAGINYTQFLIKSKDKETARKIATDITAIPMYISNKMDSLEPLYKRNWVEPKMVATPNILLHVAEAKVILGNNEGIKELEVLAKDPVVGIEANTWLLANAMVKEDRASIDLVGANLSKEDRINAQMLVSYINSLK